MGLIGFTRALVNRHRSRKAQAAYDAALEANRAAWRRGDTRTINATQKALVQAQCERLRVGA